MSQRWIGFAVLGMLALGAGGLYDVGWQLSKPVPVRVGPPPADLQVQSVEFPSESGSTIHAWFSPSTTHTGAILLLPGVRANRLSMVGRAEFLHAAGDDYRRRVLSFLETALRTR